MIATRFNPLGRKFGYGDATVIEVTVTSGESFSFYDSPTLASGESEYWVDWGDGTIDSYSEGTPSHTYLTAGRFIIEVSNAISRFSCRGKTQVTALLNWGENITNASYAFYQCKNLTGQLPQWNESITSVNSCYRGCSNLTGSIPQWNESITNANYCYRDCSNLTGSIPQWNESITNALACYYGCSNLTDIWDATATDDEIMPSRITSFTGCVTSASASLRAYFYTTWGGTKTVLPHKEIKQ